MDFPSVPFLKENRTPELAEESSSTDAFEAHGGAGSGRVQASWRVNPVFQVAPNGDISSVHQIFE
ncbi:hypothetical protein FRB93_007941, partial [Tulasnella sp. JGI-2019a]